MKKIVYILMLYISATSLMAEHWSTGYYRANGDSNVYYYDDEIRWYCHVQNDTQLENFSAVDQVRVVGDISPILGLGQSLGECPWLDGFYRVEDSEAIFRLYPGNACLITSAEMLEAYGATNDVILAEAGSDFAVHRTYIGQCYWPF
jgi:hypothetical protein